MALSKDPPTNPLAVCANCGGAGHFYKDCHIPISSFGLICYRLRLVLGASVVRPEFLLVQRKDSLFFVEFVRGKYDPGDGEYIARMLAGMTREEQGMLRAELPFDRLWAHLWAFSHMKHCVTNEYCVARDKYIGLRAGCCGPTLAEMLAAVDGALPELEWGFPKGRRNMHESEQMCAIREFVEETGVQAHNLHVFPKAFDENFTGSNSVRYMHKYFMARMIRGMHTGGNGVDVPIRSAQQAREISSVRWMSLKEASAKLAASPGKLAILESAHAFVVQGVRSGW